MHLVSPHPIYRKVLYFRMPSRHIAVDCACAPRPGMSFFRPLLAQANVGAMGISDWLQCNFSRHAQQRSLNLMYIFHRSASQAPSYRKGPRNTRRVHNTVRRQPEQKISRVHRNSIDTAESCLQIWLSATNSHISSDLVSQYCCSSGVRIPTPRQRWQKYRRRFSPCFGLECSSSVHLSSEEFSQCSSASISASYAHCLRRFCAVPDSVGSRSYAHLHHLEPSWTADCRYELYMYGHG